MDFAGTGKSDGDRHPKINDNVLIGAGATILGNISVGKGAMVASGSLVLKPVPPKTMVAGSPAKEVGKIAGEAHKRAAVSKFALYVIQTSILIWEEAGGRSDAFACNGIS